MDLLLLNEQQMNRVMDMKQAIAAAKDALAYYSAGTCDIPLRTNLTIAPHEGQALFMPGWVPQAGAAGIKIVSVYPGNAQKGLPSVPATMVLLDSATGEVCAIMDGTALTRLRTGAVAGAATDLLARKNSEIFALIGTGGQAKTQLEAVLSVRPIKAVRLFSRDPAHAARFAKAMAQEMGETFGVRIEAAASSRHAVDGADIITSVTTSPTPVFDGRWLKPGAHINAVGSYTPVMAEVDPYLMYNSGKIYCDTRDALLEAGYFTQVMAEDAGFAQRISGELGELIAGSAPGREHPGEQTFFGSTGNAVLDLVTAQRIYDAAIRDQAGSFISL